MCWPMLYLGNMRKDLSLLCPYQYQTGLQRPDINGWPMTQWFKSFKDFRRTPTRLQAISGSRIPCNIKGIFLVQNSALKRRVLESLHSSLTIGHSSFQNTCKRAKCSLFWKGMKKDIHTFVVVCKETPKASTCTRNSKLQFGNTRIMALTSFCFRMFKVA